MQAAYFGCIGRIGHYYFEESLGSMPSKERRKPNIGGPWQDYIDSKDMQAGPNHGDIKLHKRAGWSCLMVTDNSVDSRGNSKSAFLFNILVDDIWHAYRLAREHYPTIIERIEKYQNKGPLIAQEIPISAIEKGTIGDE